VAGAAAAAAAAWMASHWPVAATSRQACERCATGMRSHARTGTTAWATRCCCSRRGTR
jgi:hypothetical protein